MLPKAVIAVSMHQMVTSIMEHGIHICSILLTIY